MKDSEEILSITLSIGGTIYMIVSQIMAFVFFIQFCKTDPILKIILVDSWYSEIKGLLWPFFIHQLF